MTETMDPLVSIDLRDSFASSESRHIGISEILRTACQIKSTSDLRLYLRVWACACTWRKRRYHAFMETRVRARARDARVSYICWQTILTFFPFFFFLLDCRKSREKVDEPPLAKLFRASHDSEKIPFIYVASLNKGTERVHTRFLIILCKI